MGAVVSCPRCGDPVPLDAPTVAHGDRGTCGACGLDVVVRVQVDAYPAMCFSVPDKRQFQAYVRAKARGFRALRRKREGEGGDA